MSSWSSISASTPITPRRSAAVRYVSPPTTIAKKLWNPKPARWIEWIVWTESLSRIARLTRIATAVFR
jgi:hypothetical protein